MAKVEVVSDRVVIRFSVAERLLALRRRDVEVPFTNITAVHKVDSPWAHSGYGTSLRRKRGSFTPGFMLGSWQRLTGPSTFAAIKRDEPGYVIETNGDPYDRVVVSASDVPSLDERATDD